MLAGSCCIRQPMDMFDNGSWREAIGYHGNMMARMDGPTGMDYYEVKVFRAVQLFFPVSMCIGKC